MTDFFIDRVMPAWRNLAPGRTCGILATSGGPDSQALLASAAELKDKLGWKSLYAAGVNHGLRKEAGAELDLAEALAKRYKIPFERLSVEVESSGNLLAAARKARYQALNALADRVSADWIAVGHNATDQVETILLNLTRGAGLKSAAGIKPKHGRIIRPLLEISRTAILEYLAQNEIVFAQDPSNQDQRRVRSKIRFQVLPLLRQVNPHLENSFARFASLARSDEDYLQKMAVQNLAELLGPLGSLAISSLAQLPRPLGTRILRTWLLRQGLSANYRGLMALLSACRKNQVAQWVQGKNLQSSAGYLWPNLPACSSQTLAIPGQVLVPTWNITVRAEKTDKPAQNAIKKHADGRFRVAYDQNGLHLPLTVRGFRAGDKFVPFGNCGTLKVGDLFTNAKIPRPLRATWPVVCHGDEILWVVGLRRGSGAPVGSQTNLVVSLSVEGDLPWRLC